MNQKLKIGIIGTGSISNLHMGGYLARPEEAEVYACCDLNEERAKAFAKTYGIPHVFTDYHALLRLPELDAVSVTTWNNAHAPVSIAALRAGKHVLCEKPMALHSKEALEMQAVAKETGKLLMIGFVRRFGQNVSILKDFIQADRVGKIDYVQASCIRRAGNPGGWFSDKARSGGGPLIDLGVHMIDLGLYLMGKPRAVSVYGACSYALGPRLDLKQLKRYTPMDFDPFCDVEDRCVAIIRFENDAILSVEVSFSDHIPENHLALYLHGEKAGAALEPTLRIHTEMDGYLADITPVYTPVKDPIPYNFREEIRHFLACIRGETACLNPAEDGVALTQILDAIYQSAAVKHEILL